MHIYSIGYSPRTKQNTTNNDGNKAYQCHAGKSSALILASLLALSSVAKAEIDYYPTYNAEETTYSTNLYTNHRRKNTDEIPLTDEEKIHRVAMFLSIFGFISPFLFNILSNTNKENTNIDRE